LHGQDSVMLLWLFSLAFLALRRGMDFEAGCFLALGLFKFQFVVPFLVVMALRKKWRALAGVVAVAAALAMISVLMVGWSGVVEYFDFVLQTDRVQAHGTIQAAGMANLRGLVTSALGDSLSRNVSVGVIAILSFLLLIAVARLWPKSAAENREQFDLSFAATVTAAVLASYHLNKHDATLLLLPIALVVRYLKETKATVLWARRLLWFALFALFYPPLHLSDNQFRYPAPVLWAMLVFVFAVGVEVRRLRAAVTPSGQH
ncbi:MAG: glycosyltransferase family 87 protein, partial [Terriglobales bacterium]